jgi:hypothetical protein
VVDEMKIWAGGIGVDIPSGWDVRIGQTSSDRPGSQLNTLLHAGNFVLPDGRGDFGSGAVSSMDSTHVLAVLFEYGRDSVHTALFAANGLPRPLSPAWFSTSQLQRSLPGQAGMQRFFVEQDRPFSLYVVLGSYQNRGHLVGAVNDLLDGVTVLHP